MAFNTAVPVLYEKVVDGVKLVGTLPASALEQYDFYVSMMAYWESKTPQTWAVVRNYIVSHTKITEDKTGIELKPEELSFTLVKILVDEYLKMASEFFTSPQKEQTNK